MKKFLYVMLLSGFVSSSAVCPIDFDGETVCSINNYKDSNVPIFQQNNAERNMQSQQTNLQPFNQKNSIGQSKEAESINRKNNAGCQFGICVQNQNNDFNNR